MPLKFTEKHTCKSTGLGTQKQVESTESQAIPVDKPATQANIVTSWAHRDTGLAGCRFWLISTA